MCDNIVSVNHYFYYTLAIYYYDRQAKKKNGYSYNLYQYEKNDEKILQYKNHITSEIMITCNKGFEILSSSQHLRETCYCYSFEPKFSFYFLPIISTTHESAPYVYNYYYYLRT